MIRILKLVNTPIWLLLVFGGAAISLYCFVQDRTDLSLVNLFLVGLVGFCWYVFSTWLFGCKRFIKDFMKQSVKNLTFIEKELSKDRLSDMVLAADHFVQSQGELDRRRLGIDSNFNLRELRETDSLIKKLDWRTLDTDGGNLQNIPDNAVYLIDVDGVRFIAKAMTSRNDFDEIGRRSNESNCRIQIGAASLEQANAMLKWLANEASRNSIFRGHVLHVHSEANSDHASAIDIVERPQADLGEIVLPDDVVSLAQKLLMGRNRLDRQLKKYGHSSKLGLLFYGPPGTGKTLLTKFLLAQIPDHTVIIPTDLDSATLRKCFRLAAYLQPTVVVIEDVDLLAGNRNGSDRRLDGLQELMNELDGLASESSTMVILSTNRPDILEPALASRPGRISQAIQFPLPNADDRSKLLRLFLGEAIVKTETGEGAFDIATWVSKTEGASPAFLRELCKRSLLMATDRIAVADDSSQQEEPALEVSDQDMRAAIHQLVVTGGPLNANVLGFPNADRIGDL